MSFIIFKLDRTGSSRLVKFLNLSHHVICIPEILNNYSGTEYTAEIHRCIDLKIAQQEAKKKRQRRQMNPLLRLIKPIPYQQQILGFSINPFKYHISSSSFFQSESFLKSKGGSHIFSLVREDVFEQAVSSWLSEKLNAWPGDTQSPKANQISSYIEESKVEIPVHEFEKLYSRKLEEKRKLTQFANDFSSMHNLNCTHLTYESIYWPPYHDLSRLESILKTRLDRELVSPSKKVLPKPQEWIKNFNQLIQIRNENAI